MRTGTTGFRGAGAGWRLAVAAALLAGLAQVAPAAVAAQAAPTRGVVVVFPESDSVEIGNLADGQAVSVKVVRNGQTIGSASGRTDLFGLFPVNRPPDPLLNHPYPTANCWDGPAPNIQPGDEVRYAYAADAAQVARQTTVADLSAGAPFLDAAGVLTVRGTARVGGERPPVASLELFLSRIGLEEQFGGTELPRQMRARNGNLGRTDEADAEGTLAYDEPASHAWTARFPDATEHDAALALRHDTATDLLWLGQEPAEGVEETTFEVGATGGKADFCAEAVGGGIVDLSPVALTVANADRPLAVDGVASDAVAAVRVELVQGGERVWRSDPIEPTGAGAGRRWTATIGPGPLGNLAQGAFRLEATFVPVDQGAAEETRGRDLTKDTAAPAAPTTTKQPGAYANGVSFNLEAEAGATIHYTRDGSAPDRGSPRFAANSEPIAVGQSATIKAVAFDAAGNRSEVAAFDYRIGEAGPRVVAVAPKRNAKNVAVKANVTVTFDGAVTGADAQTVLLKAGARRVAATVTVGADGTTVTLDPTKVLAPGKRYTVVLTAGIADAAGDALAPQSWSFTTKAARR